MRLIKVLGVALVAVFAFSAMAAAGASAHEFKSSAAKLLLLASADGPQLFTTLAGHLVCITLLGHGITETIATETQKATISYEGCTVSVGKVTTKPDEPIVAEYEFNAAGTVKILKNITILATLAGLKCIITVKSQGPLSSVKYDPINSSTEILLLSHVQGIESSATGAGCAKSYTSEKDALYVGNAFVKVVGGTITWV
jgi:hypothetical protein